MSNNPNPTTTRNTYQAKFGMQIKYGLQYCVTCPCMSKDPGFASYPGDGIRTNTVAGDTVLAKHT